MKATLLAIFVLTLSLRLSPEPSPSPFVIGQEQQQFRSGETANGKATHPNIKSSQIANEDNAGKGQRDKGGQKSAPDWITWFTGVIATAAALQLIVFIFQARYMYKGLALTRQTADAATRAVENADRTLLLTERADILLEHVDSSTGNRFTLDSVMIITLKNYGRTRANCVVSDGDIFINGAKEPVGPPKDPFPIVIAAGATTELRSRRAIGTWVNQPMVDSINSGQSSISFAVDVTYSDVFGQKHTMTAGGDYNHAQQTFKMTRCEAT